MTMTCLLRGFARAGVLLALLLATVSPSHAAPYDTPALSVVDAGLFQVTLRVAAGPSGAPSGFLVQWMEQDDFDRLGGWPAGSDPALVFCAYVGVPTLNLWGATDFRLAPGVEAMVQPGDVFDETGIVTNAIDVLQPGHQYVFRAQTVGDASSGASNYSLMADAFTMGSAECTQGFWKNHEDLWPPFCTPMILGSVDYSKNQLLAIFNEPASGNGLISLAHQLTAAQLNICNGSDPGPIASTIAAADALIDGLVCPPIGSGYLAPSATSALTEQLDRYNNGKLGGVINCPTRVRTNATWGRIKALYR
jgi:hypothetical protein